MPLKLIPPRKGFSPYFTIRGTYLRVYVDRSTKSNQKKIAAKILVKWKDDIERGSFTRKEDPTFASAVKSYLEAEGESRFLELLVLHFKEIALKHINQAAVDKAAVTLYPDATPSTRNRQVYTPVSAILKHAGIKMDLERPKGSGGTPRTAWLKEDEAFALLDAAQDRVHQAELRVEQSKPQFKGACRAGVRSAKRFKALCTFLLYTGCRLSDALKMKPGDVELNRSFVYCGITKNGKPRAVHLPPHVVTELANIEFGKERVFGFAGKTGRLYMWLDEIATAAGVIIPDRVAFHLFRHTWATWMRRHAGMDTSGLVATGAWKSRQAASVYEHVVTTEEAQKADMLPVPRTRVKSV